MTTTDDPWSTEGEWEAEASWLGDDAGAPAPTPTPTPASASATNPPARPSRTAAPTPNQPRDPSRDPSRDPAIAASPDGRTRKRRASSATATAAASSRAALDAYDEAGGPFGSPPEDDDPEEYFPPPRRGRAFLVFLMFLAVVLAGLLAGVRWYQNQLDPPGPPREALDIVIPNNTSTARIGTILHKAGVIGNPTVFRYWVQVKGKGGFEAGKYQFRVNSSFDSVLETLQDGPAVPDEQKLTIPEGFRITQIAGRIEAKLSGRSAKGFETAIEKDQIRSAYQPAGVTSLEGFLFPETYTFGMDDDEGVIASRMVETFDGVADQVGLANSEQTAGVSPYEALIVASLIEREAKVDADRGKIARVIYNRLKADMYLQIDAGIVYALNNGTTRLFEKDYKLESPYNTYVHKGLPPTPIASPGRAALEAALNPTPGDWLYYVVVSPDGTSAFANTYKEHLKNIKIAEKNGVR